MKQRSFFSRFVAILFATGCLLLSLGLAPHAHAREQAAQLPARAGVQSPAAAVAPTVLTNPAVEPPAHEADAAPDELAERIQRREVISQATGISMRELDDLFGKLNPSDEEKRPQNGPGNDEGVAAQRQ
jgi:hypothetical protein